MSATPATDELLVQQRGPVLWLTINREARRNAVSHGVLAAMARAIDSAQEQRELRAIVITGAGDKAFCAGSDIKEINRTGRMVSTETLMRAIPGVGIPLYKPVIAALHGHCVGMGMTLALHCDMRIAARNALIGYPEVKHGMISAVSAIRLPQVIPSARALEMLLLARNLSAEEAHRIGLVNAVVDNARAEAEAWAGTIAGYPPAGVQATKRLALFTRRASDAERAEIEAVRGLVEARDDYKRGAATFVERP